MAFRIGQFVAIHREKPAAGTWKRYVGLTGMVRVINHDYRIEYGVTFSMSGRLVWFYEEELVPAIEPDWFEAAPIEDEPRFIT